MKLKNVPGNKFPLTPVHILICGNRVPYMHTIDSFLGAMECEMPRVTMGLTNEDVDNANHIFASTPARTRAQAVSFALALTRFLVEQRRRGANLILDRNGEYERVIMPELESVTEPNQEKLRKREAAAAD